MSDDNIKKLLLVEDEAIIAIAQKQLLEKFGYSVITANSGEKAFDVFMNSNIDLVLMDIDLGKGIDGTEAATMMLKMRQIPIVFLSSHTEPAVVEKTEKITSYGYVVKNSGITVLDASIKMAFKLFEANRQIVESEIKQKAMISGISDVIAIISADAVVRYTSPNIEKLFGWIPDEIVGRECWMLVHHDDRGLVRGEFLSLLERDNATRTLEFRYVCRDGSLRPVELIATNFLNDPVIGGILINYRDFTERYKAQEIIRESESLKSDLFEKLNTAQKIARIGSWEWDLKTNSVWWSDETYRIFGVRKNEYIPDFGSNGKFIHPDDIEQYVAKFDYSLKNGTPLDYEFRLITGDGVIKNCIARGEVGYGSSGKPVRFTGTVHDVTSRRLVEDEIKAKNEELEALNEELNGTIEEMETANEELIESNRELIEMDGKLKSTMAVLRNNELRMRTLMRTIPDLVWLKDMDGVYLACNEMFERFFGAKEEYIIGRTDYDFMSAELADFFIERDHRAIEAGRPTINEEWVTFADDGHNALLETIKTPMYDESGNLIGVLGIGRDITGRKRVEDELRESGEKYRILTENIKDVVWILDTETMHFLYVSPSVKHLRGYTAEEILAQPVYAAFAPEASEHLLSMIRGRAEEIKSGEKETGIFYIDEAEQPCKNGSTVWTEVITGYYINEKTGHVEVRGVTRDITDRRKAEEKIITLLEEKDLLMKEVHHRIRNFMNTINSLLILQASTLKDPEAINALEEAGGRLHCMMMLYEKLYETEDFKKASLKSYIPSLVEEIISNFPDSSLVKIDMQTDDFVLDAKKLQTLGIILNELLTNIMKYAFNGISDRLVTISTLLSGGCVRFTIQDNGKGIPDTVDLDKSAGFGLILVSMLAKQLKGEIHLERQSGTKFILVFDV